jgi:hypothetical protein
MASIYMPQQACCLSEEGLSSNPMRKQATQSGSKRVTSFCWSPLKIMKDTVQTATVGVSRLLASPKRFHYFT